MFPKRCKSCRKVQYTKGLKTLPVLCECGENAGFVDLANICCVMPAEKGSNVIFHSEAAPPEFPVEESREGTAWKTACNAKVRPVNMTDQPEHCTCFECVKYLTENNLFTSEEPEPEVEVSPNTTITIDGEYSWDKVDLRFGTCKIFGYES